MNSFTGPPVDQDLLDFAVDLAVRAGQLAADRFFGGAARSSLKPDGTEVTDAGKLGAALGDRPHRRHVLLPPPHPAVQHPARRDGRARPGRRRHPGADRAANPVVSGHGSVLATNGHLHDDLLALVAGLPASRDWRALIEE